MVNLIQKKLPENWEFISSEIQGKFSQELKRELFSNHVLYNVEAFTVARKIGRDDYLFSILHPEYKFAEVHLTWSIETESIWPSTSLFKNFDDWKQSIIDDELW